jgi:hypothetical protein
MNRGRERNYRIVISFCLRTVEKWQFGCFWQSPNMAAWTRCQSRLSSPPMSGPSSLLGDSFVNDAYNIPHNNVLHFPQPKGPEHTISNYAHATEVNFTFRSNNLFLMIRVSVCFFTLHVISCLGLSRHPTPIRKCSICVSTCAASTSKIRVTGTKV